MHESKLQRLIDDYRKFKSWLKEPDLIFPNGISRHEAAGIQLETIEFELLPYPFHWSKAVAA